MADPDDYRLAQYRQLREGIRAKQERSTRTMMRGIGASGVVAAYGLYTDASRIVLAVIPVIIGVLFVTHVLNMSWLARNAAHIVDLQDRVSVPGFEWEREYGMYSDSIVFWERVPRVAFYALFVSVYVATLLVGVSVTDGAGLPSVLGIPAELVIRAGYLSLTVVMLVAAYSFIEVKNRHRPTQ